MKNTKIFTIVQKLDSGIDRAIRSFKDAEKLIEFFQCAQLQNPIHNYYLLTSILEEDDELPY